MVTFQSVYLGSKCCFYVFHSIDKDHLSRYKALCGYDINGPEVPICYPETIFMRLLAAAVINEKFCLSPLGMTLFT